MWRKVGAVVVVIIAISVAVALVIFISRSPARGTTLVEILGLFLSWPVIAGALSLGFGLTFRQEIRQYLERVSTVRFPGGAEIHTRQAPALPAEKKEEVPSAERLITLGPDDLNLIQQHVEKLQECLTQESQRADLTEENLRKWTEAMTRELRSKYREVAYWRFQYLNLFLVPHTKSILRWFNVQSAPSTEEFFHRWWTGAVPDSKERKTVLAVLLFHQLIQAEGKELRISEDGKSFLVLLGEWGAPHSRTQAP